MISVILFNYHAEMKDIKNRMTKVLNLMDEVASGNIDKKEDLRKEILDNYNDLPRKTLDMIEELVENIKNKE